MNDTLGKIRDSLPPKYIIARLYSIAAKIKQNIECNSEEKKTLEKTRSSIKSLTEIAPSTALRISGEVIDIDDVKINDELLVKTGAQILCFHPRRRQSSF